MKTERPVVGFLGAGNVLGASLGQLDRLVARGVAELGPVWAHSSARRSFQARRAELTAAVVAVAAAASRQEP